MEKYYKLNAGRVVVTDKTEASIVVLVNPEQEEINELAKEHNLDEHTLSSTLDSDELARLEYEDDHIALIYKRPRNYSATEHLFRISSAGFFLFEDLAIVISDSELPLTDEKKFSKLSSLEMFMLKLLNLSILHFNDHLRIINRMSDELETRMIHSNSGDQYPTVFGLSKSLVYYINAISSNESLLKKLQMSRSFNFKEAEKELLDDIIIENSQCRRQAEIYSNVLHTLLISHESMVSNRMNALVKTLNVITVGIMVPTFVVSFFSMNIQYPFRIGVEHENPFAFWIVFFLLFFATAGFLWYQRKKKW